MPLAQLGRRGIVNSAKKRSGFIKTGARAVDADADFMQGQIATFGTDGELEVAVATSDKLVGIFNCHKATAFYKPVINESKTFTGAASTVTLANTYLRATYIVVTDSTGVTAYTETTDYTVNDTTGVITHVAAGSGGSIGTTDTVLVSYLYQDRNLSELDQTIKSKKASVMEGSGEVGLLIYDITKFNANSGPFALGTKVTPNAIGLASTGGSDGSLGYVTQLPTSADPTLYIQMELTSTY